MKSMSRRHNVSNDCEEEHECVFDCVRGVRVVSLCGFMLVRLCWAPLYVLSVPTWRFILLCYTCSRFFFFARMCLVFFFFFFSSRRRHTRSDRDWSSDVCSSD